MLQVEVTQAEVELLFEALEAWEEAPAQRGFTSAMIESVITKDQESRDQAFSRTMAESKQERLRRKRRSIMLKAKLVQSLEQESTNGLFNVANATVGP